MAKYRSIRRVPGIRELRRPEARNSVESTLSFLNDKAASVSAEDARVLRGLHFGRSGVATFPTKLETDNTGDASREVGEKKEPGTWDKSNQDFAHGLWSRSSEQVVTVHLLEEVAFSPTPKMEVKSKHLVPRQTTTSTPYFWGHQGGEDQRSSLKIPILKRKDEEMIMSKIILYTYRSCIFKTKRVSIPGSHEVAFVDDGRNSETKARLTFDFDNGKSANLIRFECISLRGSFWKLFGARVVCGMNLLCTHNTSQQAARREGLVHDEVLPIKADGLGEARMMKLYQNPKLGWRSYEWIEVLGSLRKDLANRYLEEEETIILEFVEDWCVKKFGSAVALTLLSSLATTILWISLQPRPRHEGPLGSDGSETGTTMGLRESRADFKGLSGRVEAGVLLGVLVLIFGWTSVTC